MKLNNEHAFCMFASDGVSFNNPELDGPAIKDRQIVSIIIGKATRSCKLGVAKAGTDWGKRA